MKCGAVRMRIFGLQQSFLSLLAQLFRGSCCTFLCGSGSGFGCLLRRGSEHRLTEASIREWLPQLPEWALVENGHALSRTFTFKDYYRTMSFVNALVHIAHREDHHPDLGVRFDRCEVRFSTHDVGGLSENDFICAAKADALAN